MNQKSPSAIPLLSSWEEYTGLYPEGDIRGFAQWVLLRTGPQAVHALPNAEPKGSSHKIPTLSSAVELDETAQSTLLITRLHRMLRLLAKPVIKELGFTKDMEFAVLVQLAIMDRPNKKELCGELLIEVSTGVEITKRLAKRGFLLEETDEEDRRSSRLSLTKKGKQAITDGYQKLSLIHQDFLQGFTAAQKKDLVALLTALNDHHTARLKNAPPGMLD
jgi:DNA-binding MarR family transcriptional regulator